jgi:hypothetical protein
VTFSDAFLGRAKHFLHVPLGPAKLNLKTQLYVAQGLKEGRLCRNEEQSGRFRHGVSKCIQRRWVLK